MSLYVHVGPQRLRHVWLRRLQYLCSILSDKLCQNKMICNREVDLGGIQQLHSLFGPGTIDHSLRLWAKARTNHYLPLTILLPKLQSGSTTKSTQVSSKLPMVDSEVDSTSSYVGRLPALHPQPRIFTVQLSLFRVVDRH